MIKRLFQRAYHLGERLLRESGSYYPRARSFGWKVANAAFVDGLIPPGKSEAYITTISSYVDAFMADQIEHYCSEDSGTTQDTHIDEAGAPGQKTPIWCCWWQGKESMPELVRLCHDRLLQVIPEDKAELHLITLDNYQQYVSIPEHIIQKYEAGIITMTTLSDVLRFQLLNKYGGYWLDATVFFTGKIPEAYFSGDFYCQRMVGNTAAAKREACGCNWCGFSMAGPKNLVVFRYMNDAFSKWWEAYDSIVDYVLIDYLLLSGFRHVPAIREIIDRVPDNNEDIFEMYQVLNQPYSDELYQRLIRRNVMHKLTYKMDLQKETADGKMTLYGFLVHQVYDNPNAVWE